MRKFEIFLSEDRCEILTDWTLLLFALVSPERDLLLALRTFVTANFNAREAENFFAVDAETRLLRLFFTFHALLLCFLAALIPCLSMVFSFVKDEPVITPAQFRSATEPCHAIFVFFHASTYASVACGLKP